MMGYIIENTFIGVIIVNINKNIISFAETAEIAANSEKTVLLVRHSYRESLVNGNHDPGLTAAGWEYAVECGKFLKGMKNICFGASARKRTMETVKGLISGAGFEADELFPCPVLHDTAMFTPPENLGIAIENGTIPELLKSYFTTGTAPGMRHIKEFAPALLDYLTGDFPCPNVLLSTHDIVVVALLSYLQVYEFKPDDWCGYIQGAFLYQQNGNWNIAYCVPDKLNRPLTKLFV